MWTPEIEDNIDAQFISRIQAEVTQSCALPFPVPVDRIPEFIIQAAGWFWANVDQAVEERMYLIKNAEICKGNGMNKIIQLPPQIMSVLGCHKLQDNLRVGPLGDVGVERLLLSSYSMGGGVAPFGGVGSFGMVNTQWRMEDAVMTMWEVDTFNQNFNPPITYNFNEFSSKLVLLGALGRSDLVIHCYVRCRIQDLYNSYYFFRLCVAFCRRALNTIYGTYEFKLPGGVSINYSSFSEQADREFDEIKEWAENTRAVDYFFQPKTV